VLAPRWLAWHAFVVVAAAGMLWLGNWQFHRAIGGNALSWAYTFEWPVFAVFGIVFWIKTMLDEAKPAAPAADGTSAADRAAAGLPLAATGARPAGPGAEREPDDEDDIELDEYNAYLDKLNRQVQGHGRRHGLR